MEIGGYMSMEMNYANSFHENALKFNTGRNALRVLLKSRKYKRIFLPYYICNSVIEACNNENCEIIFYNIDYGFKVKEEGLKLCEDTDCLYIVNYFGIITDEQIIEYKVKYQNIIVDNIQAFFVEPVSNIDTIYSCRKFFGVPDGAYLYTNCFVNEKYIQDVSYDRMRHILGRYEISAEKFYEDYVHNEQLIDQLPIRYMSKLTRNLLNEIDYDLCKQKRKNNYVFLFDNLQKLNKLDLIRDNRGLFAFPLYIKDGEKKRLHLIEKKIFIPQYWKEVKDRVEQDTVEYKFVSNILWLPCDQRYTLEDMEYLINEVKRII